MFEICLYHVQVFLLNLKKLNKAILQSLTIKEHQSKIRRKCRFDSLTVPSHKTFRAGGVILLLSTKLTSLHICSFLTKKKNKWSQQSTMSWLWSQLRPLKKILSKFIFNFRNGSSRQKEPSYFLLSSKKAMLPSCALPWKPFSICAVNISALFVHLKVVLFQRSLDFSRIV